LPLTPVGRCGNWPHEDFPPVRTGSDAAAAAVALGLGAGRSPGAVRGRPGGHAGPWCHRGHLRRGAGLPAVPPVHDDEGAVVRLLHGDVLVAADGGEAARQRGVPVPGGREPAGLQDGQRLPEAARGGAVGAVRAGPGDLPGVGAGEAGSGGGGRDEDQGQRVEAQGDELRPVDGEGGGSQEGDPGDLPAGGGDRPGGGPPVRSGPARRRGCRKSWRIARRG